MKLRIAILLAALLSTLISGAPALAVGETLDQFSGAPGYANAGLNYRTERFQTFTAGSSGILARIDLALSRQTTETNDPISVKLFATDSNGYPDESSVLAQTSIVASRIGRNKGWVRTIFSNPYSVVAGTKYALKLSTTQLQTMSIDGSQAGFNWYGRDWNEADYVGGEASTYVIDLDRWYRNQYDMGLKTYLGAYNQPATSVTYNLDGGTSTLPTEDNQSEGDTFVVATTPTRPGFLFNGWTDQGGTVFGGLESYPSVYTMGASNIVLKANWLPLTHPIARIAHNNGLGGDNHWSWSGGSPHEAVDVQPGWCVIQGAGSDPSSWFIIGHSSDAESETFTINTPNQFQANAYTFSPDPNISIAAGSEQEVKPNEPIETTSIVNVGCPANHFKVEPALPEGLTLDTTTGSISGTPSASKARTVYTVTAERLLNEDTLALDPEGLKLGEHSTTFTLTVANVAVTPVIAKPFYSTYFGPNSSVLSAVDILNLKLALSKLKSNSKLKIVAYNYGNSAHSTRLAKALIAEIKKVRPRQNTQIVLKWSRSAPKAATGSVWLPGSYRVDITH